MIEDVGGGEVMTKAGKQRLMRRGRLRGTRVCRRKEQTGKKVICCCFELVDSTLRRCAISFSAL